MSGLEEIAEFIQENDDFVLATHISPDGDAIGSAVALSLGLDSLGKKNIVFDRDPVPDFYCFTPNWDKLTSDLSAVDTKTKSLILLDCNETERAAVEKLPFKNMAVIDHHRTASNAGGIRWIDPEAPATGVMIHRLLKRFGVKITSAIANNIYTAIAVDTGTFRYNNTTAEAFRIAGEMIECGVVPSEIAECLYETWTSGRFKLLTIALRDTEIIDDRFAVMVVTKKMHEETATNAEDTENFPGFPRMMKDIVMSALFREVEPEYYKVSLRSRGTFDVASIAEGFGGGGHINAAGYRVRKDLETAKRLLIETARAQYAKIL